MATKTTIKSGQTLSGIAKANNTTVSAIMKANPSIKNANVIKAGASISIPSSSSGSSSSSSRNYSPAPTPTPAKNYSPAPAPSSSNRSSSSGSSSSSVVIPQSVKDFNAQMVAGNTGGGSTFTSTTPKTEKPPAGTPVFSSGTANLTLGSTGNDVKALQTYLNTTGALGANGKALATDGVYGPETQAAVRQFQANNGLKVDGVAGTNTKSTIMRLATSDSTLNANGTIPTGNEEITVDGNILTDKNGQQWDVGDNATALSLKGIMDGLKQHENETKQKINPNLSLTPLEISKILDAAKAKVRPEFAQKITGLQEDLKRNIKQTVDEYGNKIATAGEDFQKNLGGAREGYADAGLAFSGGRTKGELGMQTAENRNLASLSSQYGGAIGDYARNQEKFLGSDAMSGYNLPTLSNYQASLGGSGAYNTSGTASTGWSPGTYKLGSLQTDEAAASKALRDQMIDEASKKKVGGISYADLLSA